MSYVFPPAYGTRAIETTVEPSRTSPARSDPTARPSAVLWPGDTSSSRPSARTTWTISCPGGASTLPTATTTAPTREPSAACVHTTIPTPTSVTRTGPRGVAISVDAARQIGQLGGPVAVRELRVTMPSTRTVPATISYAV